MWCWSLLLCLGMVSCGSVEKDGKRMQKILNEQEQIALDRTELLANNLQDSFDSIWHITQHDKQDATMFYVFDNERMVYWTDNWLAAQEVRLLRYNEWYYWRFDNAHCVCRWTRAAPYNILTVIPIQYAYSVENQQLRNTFIRPFTSIKHSDVTFARNEDYASIFADDGRYLFSLMPAKEIPDAHDEQNTLAETFSYQALLASNDEGDGSGTWFHNKGQLYFALGILLFTTLITLGIVGLIRNRGFRNMRLQTKFMYGIMSLVVVISIYIFMVSTVYMRRSYEQQQQKVLQRKTRYLQKSLQDLYYWNINLGPQSREGKNFDLRDLSFAYEMDIHVYDMTGKLLGTSTPELFERGLLSSRIAPEPFFSKSSTMVQREQIGDMRYLVAYTELYNGNYVQIGYISAPLFISADEVNAQADAFLAKLFPPTLGLILLSFLLSMALSRGLTQPLSSLADKMKQFRIGHKNNRLHYAHNDEVGQLVVRYNELVEQLEQSAEQLAKSEREGAWRTMARQIAHEINNSLTPMKLTIQQLQRTKQMGDERFDSYFKHSTKLLIEQIDNLSHIAQSFSSFAKLPEVVTTEVDVAQKLTSVIELCRNNSSSVPIRYIGADRSVTAMADSEQIGRVFTNLIKNAIQAVENHKDGDIIIMLKKLPTMVEISISDNGSGIPEDIQDKVFRPNFTTKSTGMGLGLAISKNIVEGSGGKISFKTSPKGTTFYVHLQYALEEHAPYVIEVED